MGLSLEKAELFANYAIGKIDSLGVHDEFYNYTISDVNSSKMREELTLIISGYSQVTGKLGHDGQDKITEKFKEVKPKLYTGKSLSGTGNFTDLTLSRLERLKRDNIDIVVSLFAYNRLVYIMEFPIRTIYERLYNQVYEKCVIKQNDYCRSANFSYKHYMDSDNLKIKYIDLSIIDKYPEIINKPFTKKLREKCTLI